MGLGISQYLIVITGCLVLTGCGLFQGSECPAGLGASHVATLYFGRNIDGREGISDSDWQNFAAREIAPRFGSGYTVSDATGQWRGVSGQVIAERTKMVTIVLSGASDEGAQINALRDAYKSHFHQESVLLVENKACTGF